MRENYKKKYQSRGMTQIVVAWIVMVFMAAGHGIVAEAATIYVGAEETFTTIQSAIDAAQHGDTIVVKDGTYTGGVINTLIFKERPLPFDQRMGLKKPS